MNSEEKKKNNRKVLAILLAILAVLGLVSAAIAASRISGLTTEDNTNYIPIGDDTSSTDAANTASNTGSSPEAEMVIEKDVQIFRVSYSNSTGEVTVLSCDGDKLIAPGTDWKYNFTLRNTKSVSLDYTLRVEAFVEGTDYTLPVLGRMKGRNGWMTGNGGDFVPVLDLDGLTESGVLAGGNVAEYKLFWKWPFESGGEEADAFDTMLGNTAAFENDIVLTIRIIVYAEADVDPDKPGGDPVPPTGDDFSVGLWLTVMIVSLFAFILVLAGYRRKNSD